MTSNHVEYREAMSLASEMDTQGDGRFLSTFEREDDTGGNTSLHVYVLDSYHQGMRITLNPDGTYSVMPTGG